jgi:hypothetical protein
MEEYDISIDGKEVVFSVQPPGKASQLWLAQMDGSSPPRLIASAGEIAPRFGPDGQVLFQFKDGRTNYVGRMRKDGSDRSRAFPDPIIDLYNISPDRRWVVAGVPSGDRRPTVAIPVGGGPSRRICGGYCPVIWAPNGKFLYVGIASVSHASRGKTLAIPVAPGETLPQLPASGIQDVDAGSTFPGSRVIEGWNISPGPDPSVFAYVKTTVHRNLYRIPLP